MRAIGLMSGTSMDGVDVALIDADGEDDVAFGPSGFRAYSEAERALLRQALVDALPLQDRAARPGVLAEAERAIGIAHAEAVEAFLAAQGLGRDAVAVVGFHGQTVLHRPERALTVQIGDGAALARRLKCRVVYDFRAEDVAAGGQGAPLVPIFHRALVRAAGLEGTVAVLNIGGVSNVTIVGEGDPIACDLGPGNALIDDLMLERTGQAIDEDGVTAAKGRVDQRALEAMLSHPFFALPPPKSLDRNAFSRRAVADLATPDAAATLTAFTAQAIARIVPLLPVMPDRWVVCGGGAFNPTLMRMLRARLNVPVDAAEALGWSSASMEAQAFAYLAVRKLNGKPITFPTTTGVPAPAGGGVVAEP